MGEKEHDEFLVIYSTGGPDTFMLCEGTQQFDEFVAFATKQHWPIRRTARVVSDDEAT
jgi:hypothetical protein